MDAGTRRLTLDLPEIGVRGAVVLALATGLVSWLVLSRHHAAPPAATTAANVSAQQLGPVALDESDLRARVATFQQPVYWLGPARGETYELKRTSDGSVFLRYLPAGTAAGDPAPFRTVGTYPFPAAYSATHRLAEEAGTVWFDAPGGGIAVYRRSRPTNVYLAWPGVAYQVEVFDPSAAAARRLALSARLRRLGGT